MEIVPTSKRRKKRPKPTRAQTPRHDLMRLVQDDDRLGEDEPIIIRRGRPLPSSAVVPGPGNRAGFNADGTSFLPNAMIFDSRLDAHATVAYAQLLMAQPPLEITWEEPIAYLLELPRHSEDSEQGVLDGAESLRRHGYLRPCESGWTLDVPDDAEEHSYFTGRSR